MASVQCFLIEPTDRVRRWLRRYTDSPSPREWKCEAGWHEAKVQIEDGPAIPYRLGNPDYDGIIGTDPMEWPHDDPRWPAQCDKGCGYAFVEADRWQLFYSAIFRVVGGSQEMLNRLDLDESALGAMWWAKWLPKDWWGPEGKGCLCVNTPGGMWPIDGPAFPANGTSIPHAWSRTGEPPLVTARPSILIGNPPRYHGFLADGILSDT